MTMSAVDELSQLRERVAVVESKMTMLERSQIDQTVLLKENAKSMEALHRRFDKQYSFIGGIVFVVTGLWAVVQFVLHFFGGTK